MGVAVCGTHYTGMGSATYEYSAENYSITSRVVVSGAHASIVASHGSLLMCYWLSATAVVVSLRTQVMTSASSKRNQTSVRPATGVSTMSQGPHSVRGAKPNGVASSNFSEANRVASKNDSTLPMQRSNNSVKMAPPVNMVGVVPD